jgi:AcrR family transcriptional regulator
MNKKEDMSDRTGKQVDKQDRRSQRTRQALIDALISLLAVKHYDAISIKDIVDQANVGRSTFYAHYQTKDDLLKSGFERVLDMLLQHITLSETNQNLNLDTTPLFRHAQSHYELYRTLAWGSGFELITMEGHAMLSAKLLQRLSKFVPGRVELSVPLPILSYSLAGSLLILLKWWLDNKMLYSPERMDEIFQRLVMPGIRDTLVP